MMNCIPYSPGRGRFDHRVIDANDDDESVEEFLKAHPCLMEREKAEEFEASLGQAISMAERDSGSLLALQHMNKMNAIEMGRRISSLRSMKDGASVSPEELEDLKNMQNLATARSFASAASLPTFLKVEKRDASLLHQRSWESMNQHAAAGDTDEESTDLDEEDHPEQEDRGVVSNMTPAPTPSRTRSWNKLRKTLNKEERDAKQQQSKSRRSFGMFRRNKSNENVLKGVAKDAPVEVALQPAKKRGWGRLRRNSKATPKQTEKRQDQLAAVPVTPLRIPDEISRDAEEEDFFVNDANVSRSVDDDVNTSMESAVEESVTEQQQSRDVSLFSESEEEEEKQEYDPMNVSYEEAQSMEIFYQEKPRMCGLGSGPGFDIIGATALLKGIETSWRDLKEDSFDIVPRKK